MNTEKIDMISLKTEKIGIVDDTNILSCPLCKGKNYVHNLHQTKVEVFFREQQDIDGLKSTCGKSYSKSTPVKAKNIPGRRDSIYIYFKCEEHGDLPVKLAIVQHKGPTYMAWVDVDKFGLYDA